MLFWQQIKELYGIYIIEIMIVFFPAKARHKSDNNSVIKMQSLKPKKL